MLDISCRCGAVYHADLAHIGRQLKCSQCGLLVFIESPLPAVVVPKADSIQTPKYARNVPVKSKQWKSHSRWAAYLGATTTIVLLAAIWFGHSHPQSRVAKPTQAVEVTPTANPVNSPPLVAKDSHIATNPFGLVPGNTHPSSFRQNDQPSDTSEPPLEPRPLQYNSLPTGTRLADDAGLEGHGRLSVSNGTGLDAVVRLYDPSTLKTARWFFVKAGASATVQFIPQGKYVLAYTDGLDWDESETVFRWNPSYHEFEKLLSYTEQTDVEAIRFEKITITLNPVIGGNIKAKSISRNDFLRGHGHASL